MMTEACYLSPTEVAHAQSVHEVWVPTEFHFNVFATAGIPAAKLFVLPEAVNYDFFAEDDDGNAYVVKQPESADEIELCTEQMEACPVCSIGNDGA